METTSMMRVNPYPGSYGGHSNAQQDRQQQRRQKILALFDALEHGHLDAAKQALKILMNFDHAISTDAHFVHLSKALNASNMYIAQQIMRDIKTKFINATPLIGNTVQMTNSAKPHVPDGMHFVDTQA